jgi:hypothetical protein
VNIFILVQKKEKSSTKIDRCSISRSLEPPCSAATLARRTAEAGGTRESQAYDPRGRGIVSSATP